MSKMARVYIADLKNDLGAYVAWQIDYQERTGLPPDVGRDAQGDFVEVPDETDAMFAKLRFG